MTAGYYLAFSYAVRINCGQTKYFRGIFSCGEDRKYFINIKRASEFKFSDTLSLNTLRKYKAEVLPNPTACRAALKALMHRLKKLSGVAVKPEHVMHYYATEVYPEGMQGDVTYARAEVIIGKVRNENS